MVIALSIVFAALVGGVVFVLLDNLARREAAPTPKPEPPVWEPPRPAPQRTEPLPPRKAEEPQGSLWSGWSRR